MEEPNLGLMEHDREEDQVEGNEGKKRPKKEICEHERTVKEIVLVFQEERPVRRTHSISAVARK